MSGGADQLTISTISNSSNSSELNHALQGAKTGPTLLGLRGWCRCGGGALGSRGHGCSSIGRIEAGGDQGTRGDGPWGGSGHTCHLGNWFVGYPLAPRDDGIVIIMVDKQETRIICTGQRLRKENERSNWLTSDHSRQHTA